MISSIGCFVLVGSFLFFNIFFRILMFAIFLRTALFVFQLALLDFLLLRFLKTILVKE